MWPCIALDGHAWPYRLWKATLQNTRRNPAWPCAAVGGTGACPNLSNASCTPAS